MKIRNVVLIPSGVAIILALAACGGEPPSAPADTPAASPTPAPVTTEAPSDRVFALPDDCTGLLSESKQQEFSDQGLILLGGPGGKYEQYYGDPTPEERVGGISCIWGDEDVPQSIVTVSAAPLDAATRSNVVDDLLTQGLNEAVLDDGISYAQIGDDVSAPAVLNIVRDDSWISVIQALGGEAYFDEAVQLAGDAELQVYGP